jgi:hypothetical protein
MMATTVTAQTSCNFCGSRKEDKVAPMTIIPKEHSAAQGAQQTAQNYSPQPEFLNSNAGLSLTPF